MSVWINGRVARRIDWRDRGLHYGDGVFETMRIRRGELRLLDLHLERLYASCARLAIQAPPEADLRRELVGASRRRREGVLKLIVTRGPGARGYRPSGHERATRLLALAPLPTFARGVPLALRICRTRLGCNPALAGMKTLNRLESVLARAEWSDPRIGEGLMLDHEDRVVCGTMSNVFIRRANLLLTPPVDRCGVAGVMRRFVLERAASLGLRATESPLRFADLQSADEVFMTNALRGPMPVGAIGRGASRRIYREHGAANALLARLEAR
ncbi:MAG: aminodeoxychorismate lyase [Gammaproteobacteria bacterium]|nr:aminodeoxychorismate lyase [Gammaproteobacteria bacterium]